MEQHHTIEDTNAASRGTAGSSRSSGGGGGSHRGEAIHSELDASLSRTLHFSDWLTDRVGYPSLTGIVEADGDVMECILFNLLRVEVRHFHFSPPGAAAPGTRVLLFNVNSMFSETASLNNRLNVLNALCAFGGDLAPLCLASSGAVTLDEARGVCFDERSAPHAWTSWAGAVVAIARIHGAVIVPHIANAMISSAKCYTPGGAPNDDELVLVNRAAPCSILPGAGVFSAAEEAPPLRCVRILSRYYSALYDMVLYSVRIESENDEAHPRYTVVHFEEGWRPEGLFSAEQVSWLNAFYELARDFERKFGGVRCYDVALLETVAEEVCLRVALNRAEDEVAHLYRKGEEEMPKASVVNLFAIGLRTQANAKIERFIEAAGVGEVQEARRKLRLLVMTVFAARVLQRNNDEGRVLDTAKSVDSFRGCLEQLKTILPSDKAKVVAASPSARDVPEDYLCSSVGRDDDEDDDGFTVPPTPPTPSQRPVYSLKSPEVFVNLLEAAASAAGSSFETRAPSSGDKRKLFSDEEVEEEKEDKEEGEEAGEDEEAKQQPPAKRKRSGQRMGGDRFVATEDGQESPFYFAAGQSVKIRGFKNNNGLCFANAAIQLFAASWGSLAVRNFSYGASVLDVCRELGYVHKAGVQEDAEVILQLLLERHALVEDRDENADATSDLEAAATTTTTSNELLYCMQEFHWCAKCGAKSAARSVRRNSLVVELKRGRQPLRLQDALDRVFEKQRDCEYLCNACRLEESGCATCVEPNSSACEICSKARERFFNPVKFTQYGERQATMTSHPQMLFIFGRRFKSTANGAITSRLGHRADPPRILRVQGVDYRLKGVASHIGDKLERGHWIAFVRGGRGEEECWYECNDDVIGRCTASSFERGRSLRAAHFVYEKLAT